MRLDWYVSLVEWFSTSCKFRLSFVVFKLPIITMPSSYIIKTKLDSYIQWGLQSYVVNSIHTWIDKTNTKDKEVCFGQYNYGNDMSQWTYVHIMLINTTPKNPNTLRLLENLWNDSFLHRGKRKENFLTREHEQCNGFCLCILSYFESWLSTKLCWGVLFVACISSSS